MRFARGPAVRRAVACPLEEVVEALRRDGARVVVCGRIVPALGVGVCVGVVNVPVHATACKGRRVRGTGAKDSEAVGEWECMSGMVGGGVRVRVDEACEREGVRDGLLGVLRLKGRASTGDAGGVTNEGRKGTVAGWRQP